MKRTVFEIENLNKIYQTAYDYALILADQYDISNPEQWAKDYAKIELNQLLGLGKPDEIILSDEHKLELGVSLSTGIENNAFKITTGKGSRADTILFPSDKNYTYHLECFCHNKGGKCKGNHYENTNYRCETIAIGYEDVKKMFGWRNIPINSSGEPYLTEFYMQFNNGMVSQSY